MKEYLLAFLNGFLSFASPCVLPLIPGYLSLISGFSAKDIIEGREIERKRLFLLSFFFVVGFSLVFSLFGGVSSFAGSFLIRNRLIFEKIAGIIVFVLGIHIAGILKIPFLNYEKRVIFKGFSPNYLTSFITGISFAFGWSPCIGPFLATILTLASTKSVFEGITLLFVYAIGMGIPFLIISLFGGFLFNLFSSKRLLIIWLERIAGVVISIIGILIFSGRFFID